MINPSQLQDIREQVQLAQEQLDTDWSAAVLAWEAANLIVVADDDYPDQRLLLGLNRALLGAIECTEEGFAQGTSARMEEIDELLVELAATLPDLLDGPNEE